MYIKIGSEKFKIVVANTFYKKFKGLMGKTDIDYGLLIPNCNSIHTFFMKENIDVVGINENNEIIYKYEDLEKNKAIKIENKQKNTSILELPAHTSKKLKLGYIIPFIEE